MDKQTLLDMKAESLKEAAAAKTLQDVEAVRIKYLSRKGLVPEIMKNLKDVAPEERPEFGQLANQVKTELQTLLDAKKAELESASASSSTSAFDYSQPGQWRGLGSKHPITQIIERAVDIFRSIGFTVADGPDVETEYYNFDALNTPAHHAARDSHDTFYLETGELLRTQTSPVQIRVMENQKPPVRIVAPGRCYRRDTTDATHSANFHQIEGLYIDKGVSLADLKGDMTYFAQQLMGPGVKVRFRTHFFPFTEPSVEYDFSCHVCGGNGCRVCKNSGWIEISGAGMVNPKVLRTVGYDPEEVSGYAFGMGIERMAMILFGINDIRMLYENDVRFLEQFA